MSKKDELYKIVNRKGQKKEATFSRYHDPNHQRFARYHKRFPLILDSIIGPKVLDVGCGTGLTCFLASKLDYVKEIHGVDLQKVILEEAKQNVTSKKVTFHEGFGEELDFKDGDFNTVVMTETLEHVYSVDKALSEAHRVLKLGGKIVITCPYKGKINKLHVRSITQDFMKNHVKKYFKIEKFQIVTYPGPGPQGIFCVGVKK